MIKTCRIGIYPKRKALPRAYLLFLSYHIELFLSRRKSHAIMRLSPCFYPLFTLSSQVKGGCIHTLPRVSFWYLIFTSQLVIANYAIAPHFKHNILFQYPLLGYILSLLFLWVTIIYYKVVLQAESCHFLPFVQTVQFQLFIFYTRSQSRHRAVFSPRTRAFLSFGCGSAIVLLLPAPKRAKKQSPKRLCLIGYPYFSSFSPERKRMARSTESLALPHGSSS